MHLCKRSFLPSPQLMVAPAVICMMGIYLHGLPPSPARRRPVAFGKRHPPGVPPAPAPRDWHVLRPGPVSRAPRPQIRLRAPAPSLRRRALPQPAVGRGLSQSLTTSHPRFTAPEEEGVPLFPTLCHPVSARHPKSRCLA